MNPPYKITLRRSTFLSIGAIGGGGGSGHHAFKQTEARKFCLVPAYPLQVHQFVLGHALDVVQVEVEDAFLFVVVGVFLLVLLVVVVVVVVVVFLVSILIVIIFLVVVVVVIIFLVILILLIYGRRHKGHFSLDGGSGRCLRVLLLILRLHLSLLLL